MAKRRLRPFVDRGVDQIMRCASEVHSNSLLLLVGPGGLEPLTSRLWIAVQLFSEVGAIANNNETSDVGGVAYMAHIGGFLAGFLLTFLFRGTIAPQT